MTRHDWQVPDGTPFPDGFRFGAATAAYQIEGGITNDWTEWEEAGKLTDPSERCGLAVDGWRRFDDDVALLEDLGLTDYRLSVEWARVEPAPGVFDDDALARYRHMIDTLVERGIRPLVTLHHFTNPAWLHRQFPWHEQAVIERFERYTEKVVTALSDGVYAYFPFNEPMVFIMGGYVAGLIPPGHMDGALAARAFVNILACHAAAFRVVKAKSPYVKVGPVKHWTTFAPSRSWHPVDQGLAWAAHRTFNLAFLDAIHTGRAMTMMPGGATVFQRIPGLRGTWDLVGINYYTRTHLRLDTSAAQPVVMEHQDPHGRGTTGMGWEIYPQGFYDTLMTVAGRYDKEIWITENGLADQDGTKRVGFLHDYLGALLAAIRDGAKVTSYLHWTLMDNFEWLDGLGPRFGIYHVDFDTLDRSPAYGHRYYKEAIAARRLVPTTVEP